MNGNYQIEVEAKNACTLAGIDWGDSSNSQYLFVGKQAGYSVASLFLAEIIDLIRENENITIADLYLALSRQLEGITAPDPFEVQP